MSKELPYFKFFIGEWLKGEITVCSLSSQGLFINLCVYYWGKDCDMKLTSAQQRFNTCSTEFEELLNLEIIKVEDENLVIEFLDEQFFEFGELRKKKSKAGKASAKTRKVNTSSTPVQHNPNKEEKIREDKDKEKIKRFIPPTIEEVNSYCLERKNNVDAQRFIDHYQSKGWMIGKNKMKDWQASVRTWEKGDDKPVDRNQESKHYARNSSNFD